MCGRPGGGPARSELTSRIRRPRIGSISRRRRLCSRKLAARWRIGLSNRFRASNQAARSGWRCRSARVAFSASPGRVPILKDISRLWFKIRFDRSVRPRSGQQRRGDAIPRRKLANQLRKSAGVGSPGDRLPAPRIHAAFTRNECRIVEAGIIESAIPTTSLPPFAPHNIVAQPTMRIARFSGCAVDALMGLASHGRSRQDRNGEHGGADYSEFHCWFPSLGSNNGGVSSKVPARIPKIFLVSGGRRSLKLYRPLCELGHIFRRTNRPSVVSAVSTRRFSLDLAPVANDGPLLQCCSRGLSRQSRDVIDSASADIGEILQTDACADLMVFPAAQLALSGGGDQPATRFPGSASHLQTPRIEQRRRAARARS